MRRAWVILLLIALLPLRGWAATGMAVPAPVAPEEIVEAAAMGGDLRVRVVRVVLAMMLRA
jgi:hypothetical protein